MVRSRTIVYSSVSKKAFDAAPVPAFALFYQIYQVDNVKTEI
jgi:hypothetical protein